MQRENTSREVNKFAFVRFYCTRFFIYKLIGYFRNIFQIDRLFTVAESKVEFDNEIGKKSQSYRLLKDFFVIYHKVRADSKVKNCYAMSL